MRIYSNNGCQSISTWGGAEHAVLHSALYARFWHKFYDSWCRSNHETIPKSCLRMILGTSYRDHCGALLWRLTRLKNVMVHSSMETGEELEQRPAKMSKPQERS